MKQKARSLYADGLNLTQIAKELGTNISTISSWKKEAGDWDDYRTLKIVGEGDELARISLNNVVMKFNDLIRQNNLNDEQIKEFETFCKLSDSFAKAVNANLRLMPKVNEYEMRLKHINEILGQVEKFAPEIKDKLILVLSESE